MYKAFNPDANPENCYDEFSSSGRYLKPNTWWKEDDESSRRKESNQPKKETNKEIENNIKENVSFLKCKDCNSYMYEEPTIVEDPEPLFNGAVRYAIEAGCKCKDKYDIVIDHMTLDYARKYIKTFREMAIETKELLKTKSVTEIHAKRLAQLRRD